MIEAPYKEIEAGTVPESGAEKYQQFVQAGTHPALPVSSQGNVQVIPEPGR